MYRRVTSRKRITGASVITMPAENSSSMCILPNDSVVATGSIATSVRIRTIPKNTFVTHENEANDRRSLLCLVDEGKIEVVKRLQVGGTRCSDLEERTALAGESVDTSVSRLLP
jgi:hypothetical protein